MERTVTQRCDTKQGMNGSSQYGMVFSNSMYSMDNIVNTFSGELNSHFSNNLSNQFLATYSRLKT